MGDTEADVDSIIERLLEGLRSFIIYYGIVRGSRPGKQVQLAEHEIRYLCTKSRDVFINQPILLELEAPIKICGMGLLANLFYRRHSRAIL